MALQQHQNAARRLCAYREGLKCRRLEALGYETRCITRLPRCLHKTTLARQERRLPTTYGRSRITECWLKRYVHVSNLTLNIHQSNYVLYYRCLEHLSERHFPDFSQAPVVSTEFRPTNRQGMYVLPQRYSSKTRRTLQFLPLYFVLTSGHALHIADYLFYEALFATLKTLTRVRCSMTFAGPPPRKRID